jgi:ribosomal protein S18 acetylase RimI-like enzyme
LKEPDFSVIAGGGELLARIEPLWYALRGHHADLAPMWRDGLLTAKFVDRKEELIQKSGGGLLVLLAICKQQAVGYCVCSITDSGAGEIDSIYVTSEHRHRGLGRRLMTQAMEWLREKKAKSIVVDVLHGNDDAVRLYERFGFRVRVVRMRHVE